MFSVYQPQSLTDLEALIPFATIMTRLPVGFVPPGILNPNYKPPDRGPLLFVITIIMSFITVPIVILRMFSRHRSSGLGSDDKVMIFAAVSISNMTNLTLHELTMMYKTGICLNSVLAILGKSHVLKPGINRLTSYLI